VGARSGVAVMVAVGVIVRVGVAVLEGRGVTVGGAGLGVTVGGPINGVRVAKDVGDGNGVRVLVGVRVGTGVPAGVKVGVTVRVGRGVRVGRVVGFLVGSLVGVSSAAGSGVVPSSISIGARVPIAVGAGRRRTGVSSGARLQACSKRSGTNSSAITEVQHTRVGRRLGKVGRYCAMRKL
jgi:hypothetical protein